MITQQKKLVLSKYTGLYDILVPADHFLRRLHDDIDFSFIYRELVDKYSESMGRTAYDPVMMFKYLILKVISKLSDVDLVNEVRVNMAYKFFLDMAPEEMPVDDSTLCKFRRTRLRDTNLTDLLLAKTFEMAEGKGILRRSDDNRIHIRAIIDGTHTVSAASLYRPVPALKEWSKKLRHQVYTLLPEMEGRLRTDKEISSRARWSTAAPSSPPWRACWARPLSSPVSRGCSTASGSWWTTSPTTTRTAPSTPTPVSGTRAPTPSSSATRRRS